MTEGVLISVEFDQFNFVPEMSKDVETALVRALNKTANRIAFLAPPLVAFYLLPFTGSPVNGSKYSFILICSAI